WDQANGALNPKNSTLDLLIGGTSTASAKFAVINVNPGSGTPTASVSGTTGAASLTSNGVLGTTNFQTLQLGNGTTGNINFFNANNSLTSGGTLTLAGNEILTAGTLQVGNTTPAAYNRIGTGTSAFGLGSTSDLYISGKLEVGGNLYSPLTGISGYLQRNAGALAPTNLTDDLLLGATAT